MSLISIALKAYAAGFLALALPCVLCMIFLFPLSILFVSVLLIALFGGAVLIAVILFLFSVISICDGVILRGRDLLLGGALFGGVVGLALGILASSALILMLFFIVVSAYIGGVAFFLIGRFMKNG